MKAQLPEVRDHGARVRETRGGELVVAPPVGLEPAGVQMDHVARDEIAPQLGRHVPHLRLRLVRDPAHPQPEGPERRDRAASGERRVLAQHVLRLAQEDEEIEDLVARINHGVLIKIMAEIERDRRARVHEHAVPVAAQEKRDGLVLPVILHALAVAQIHDQLLAALVQARERLAGAEDLLVVLELETSGRAAAHIPRAPDERERRVWLERGGVAQRLGAGQQLAGGVVELDVPGVLDETELAVGARVSDDAVAALHSPRPVRGHGAGQHEGIGVAAGGRRQVPREEAQAHGSRADESDLEG